MWGKIAVAAALILSGSFFVGSCWLVWRKPKDRREQIDIEKRIESIPPVQIAPLDLAKMKEWLWRAIKAEGQEVHVIQEPKPPPVGLADLNERWRRLCKVVSKAGISMAAFDRTWRKRGSRCSQDKS